MSNYTGVPSLKEFVDAMGTTWPVAAAISLGSAIILAAEGAGVSYVADLPGYLTTAIFFVAVFAGAVCAVAILQTLLQAIEKWKHARQVAAIEARRIKKLINLPPNEHEIMSWLFSSNTQAFAAELADRRLVPLMQKGLIVQHQDGALSVLDWPHAVPDDVWDVMEENPELFTIDLRGRRNPLRDAW